MKDQFERLSPPEDARRISLEEAEHTLRLISKLPAPEGLADRVHVRLRNAQKAGARRSWFAAMMLPGAPRLQLAAAALLMAVVAGGGWTLYRANPINPINPGNAGNPANEAGQKISVEKNATPSLATPPHQAAQGGFESSHGMHVPPTLAPIHVPPAPKKKPAAGRSSAHAGHAASTAAGASNAKPAAEVGPQPVSSTSQQPASNTPQR
jgi:hypothetical protein